MATKKKEVTEKSVTSYMTAEKPNVNVPEYKPKKFKGEFNSGTYTSQYAPQMENIRNQLTNWSYDPLKDASYQSLAKVYGQRGDIAAKNSMADAASLNGGLGTSYAVSAAQQARNQYNQELASMIPQLEQAAYGKASDLYNMYRDADNTDYNRFRDTEGDRWNQFLQGYQQFRDREGDRQFAADYLRQLGRDAMSDYFNSREFNLSMKQYKDAQAEKAAAKSGGGRSGGGGGRYSDGYIGLGVDDPDIDIDGLIGEIEEEDKKKKKGGTGGGGGYSIKTTNRLMTK